MGFWGSERLRNNLDQLITETTKETVETGHCNLRMGKEVFISSSAKAGDSNNQYVKQLKDGEWFAIPPGRFAALLTEEIVSVPDHAMALISMKAKIKFRGLVNISGFHVDPGFSGCLTFSVYNAGPAPVYIYRGQPCFMIWYADLIDHGKDARDPGHESHLDSAALVSGPVPTYENLDQRLKSVEDQQKVYIAAAGFFVSISLFMLNNLLHH